MIGIPKIHRVELLRVSTLLAKIIGLFFIYLLMIRMSTNNGLFVISSDELSRVWYAKHFSETGKYDSFSYTWLPLPFWAVGSLSKIFDYPELLTTFSINTFCCFSSCILGMLCVFIATNNQRCSDVIGLLSIITPWVVFNSSMGFAEPLMWLGLSISHVTLVYLSKAVQFYRVVPAILIGGIGVSIAILTRYESWSYSIGFPIGCLAIMLWRKKEFKSIQFKLILISIFLVQLFLLTIIVWWMWVHYTNSGNPFSAIQLKHQFTTTDVGLANDVLTISSMLSRSILYAPLILPLLLISIFPKRWNLPYLTLLIPPFFFTLLLLISIGKNGIPWIYGERVLAFSSVALLPPAVVAIWSHGDLLLKYQKIFYVGRGVLLFCLVFIFHLNLVLNPPEGDFLKERITAQLVERIERENPDLENSMIAVSLSGREEKIIADSRLLLHPQTNRLVATQASLKSSTTQQIEDCLRKINARILISDTPIPEASPSLKLHTNQVASERIQKGLANGQSLLLFTHWRMFQPVNSDISNILTQGNLQGPKVGEAGWVRYVGFLASSGYEHLGFEIIQTNDNDQLFNLQHIVAPLPKCQRKGLPGMYILKIIPSDHGCQSIVQIGSTNLQPRATTSGGHTYGGYYAVLFDIESGKVSDYFRISDDGLYSQDEHTMPYWVYTFNP